MAKGDLREEKQSFPRDLLERPPSARLEYFKAFTVAHPFLQQADMDVWNALREPAGALLIFLIGPTGVGKTTILTHIEQRLREQAQAQVARDPDHVPAIRLDAMAPSARQFRWPDFYTRALMAVSEPLIDYKVDRAALAPVWNAKMGRHVPPRLVGDAAALQRSWEQVLKYRRPLGILIDEAHHFAKTAGGTRLVDQLDHLKSLAIATQTVYVLAGTYDLLIFRNLSAELSRRSIDVHIPRYRATDKQERLAFQKVLYTFQRHLPLEEPPDLVHQWKYYYSRTIGCVGMIKDWLAKALAEALETGAKTITPAMLEHHASSPDRCDQMITDIEEGEKSLRVDPEAQERLLRRLGLNSRSTRHTREGQAENTGEEKSASTVPPRRSRVGQRNPKRDVVKTEVATDG
jgi:energy-coupling factor transporter ATP-binding protein EcfA2